MLNWVGIAPSRCRTGAIVLEPKYAFERGESRGYQLDRNQLLNCRRYQSHMQPFPAPDFFQWRCRHGSILWGLGLARLCPRLAQLRMRCEGLVPDVITYNTVMDVCQKSGHWKLALQIFGQLGSHTAADVITMNTAMGAYLRLGFLILGGGPRRYDSEIDSKHERALFSKSDVYNINIFFIVAHPACLSCLATSISMSIYIHLNLCLYLYI